jgi:hypothetical protein
MTKNSKNPKNNRAKPEKNNKNPKIKMEQLDNRLQNFKKLITQLNKENKTKTE